jgi:hypothetical protein
MNRIHLITFITTAILGTAACKSTSPNGASAKQVAQDDRISIISSLEVQLTGKTYSRSFEAVTLGDPQIRIRTHRLQFIEGRKIINNASTFFGNPPETLPYRLEIAPGGEILVVVTERDSSEATYILSPDLKSLKKDQQEFTLDASLAGKTASRTFVTRPLGSISDVQFTESLEFISATQVIDSSPTFFGNPPATLTYELVGNKVTIHRLGGDSILILSADGKSMSDERSRVIYSVK